MKGPERRKGPQVTPSKSQKLIGLRPLFFGKGPFHERKKIQKFFNLVFSSQLGVQLHLLHPLWRRPWRNVSSDPDMLRFLLLYVIPLNTRAGYSANDVR